LFGASQKVAKTWQKRGHQAESFDIKTGGQLHDMVSKTGFLHLMHLGLRLVDGGIVVGGPPCSLFVFLSSSVHMRHIFSPSGCPWNDKVRLANQIVRNVATFIRVLKTQRKTYVIFEQPAGSWMFKMHCFVELIALLSLVCGHDMDKVTHLLGDLPTLGLMQRRMTKNVKNKLKEKRAKRKANMKSNKAKVYYVADKTMGKVSGGRDLPASAYYTTSFCNALYKCWLHDFTEPAAASSRPNLSRDVS
ncbi:unnamed protein product, partial [Polarella glacialis]